MTTPTSTPTTLAGLANYAPRTATEPAAEPVESTGIAPPEGDILS